MHLLHQNTVVENPCRQGILNRASHQPHVLLQHVTVWGTACLTVALHVHASPGVHLAEDPKGASGTWTTRAKPEAGLFHMPPVQASHVRSSYKAETCRPGGPVTSRLGECWRSLQLVLQAASDSSSSNAHRNNAVSCAASNLPRSHWKTAERVWGSHLVAFKAQPQHLYGVLGR